MEATFARDSAHVAALRVDVPARSRLGRSYRRITVDTGGPPTLLAVRDDASPTWRVLPPTSATATVFEFPRPSGPYWLAVVCTSSDLGVDIEKHAVTPEDDVTYELFCEPPSPQQPAPTFHVTGTVIQPGDIAFGPGFANSRTPNWTFDFEVPASKFDMFMTSETPQSEPDSMAIRRDITVAGDLDLGVIDFTHENMQPFVSTLFNINLLTEERLFSGVAFHTPHGSGPLFVGGADGSLKLAGPGVLRPEDQQHVFFQATKEGSRPSLTLSRSFQRDFGPGASTEVPLLDPIDSPTFDLSTDQLTVRWSKIPDQAIVFIDRIDLAGVASLPRTYRLFLSPNFREATGYAMSATLDVSDLPGFQDAWRPDPADSQAVSLSVTGEFFTSGFARSDAQEVIDPTTMTPVVSELPRLRSRSRSAFDAPSMSGQRRARRAVSSP